MTDQNTNLGQAEAGGPQAQKKSEWQTVKAIMAASSGNLVDASAADRQTTDPIAEAAHPGRE